MRRTNIIVAAVGAIVFAGCAAQKEPPAAAFAPNGRRAWFGSRGPG